MASNSKYFNNQITPNLTFKESPLTTDPAFKSLVSTNYSMQLRGIIDNVILKNDVVFAVVRRDHEDLFNGSHNDSYVHGHDGLFNAYSYEHNDSMTFAELSIPTDITPVASIITRYIGKPVMVTMQNNVAIFASVLQSAQTLTTIKPSIIRQVRDKLTEKEGYDIFSKGAQHLWNLFNVTQEEVNSLKGLIYKEEDHSSKLITFEGEGNWNKDIAAPMDNEVQIKPTSIVDGLNQQGMKTNKCHDPTRIFSAK